MALTLLIVAWLVTDGESASAVDGFVGVDRFEREGCPWLDSWGNVHSIFGARACVRNAR